MSEVTLRDYTGVSTESIVIEMLTENTGRHFLDSGGAYGRNWERNQGKTFSDQPKVWWEWSQYKGKLQLMATVSLYHWMTTYLEFDGEMQSRLDAFAEAHPEMSWLELQDEFATHEAQEFGHEREPRVINTYNDPDNCDLSQVLQYMEIYSEDDYQPSHLIVCVHGGCDVRGGYTAPKCFRLDDDYWTAITNMQAHWYGTSDYSWYRDGWNSTDESDRNPKKLGNLFDLPAYDLEDLPDELQDETDLDFVALIAKASQDKEALKSTQLDEQRRLNAIDQIEATVKEAAEELRDRRFNRLCDLHEAFVYIEDRRAYLVVEGESEEICVDVD